jgi:quinone-modifying oxidoreductase, subunit QmoC
VGPAIHCRYAEDVNPNFAAEIAAQPGGEDLQHCIQCGTCSAGCPLAVYMDYTPRRIIALTRSGLEGDVLKSVTPWLCASCYECQVRCPRDLHITDIMYAIKSRAIKKGLYPKRSPIPILAKGFFNKVANYGRNSETRLVMELLAKTNPFNAFGMTSAGINMLKTGRLNLKQGRIRHPEQMKTLLAAVEEP